MSKYAVRVLQVFKKLVSPATTDRDVVTKTVFDI